MTLLFVYGSLKRGFAHHAELSSARFVSEARTLPGYRLVVQGDYPALVEAADGVVFGEVFEVDNRLLAALDAFESVPTFYRRSQVRLAGGEVVDAYFAARTGPHRFIESGVWRE